MTTQTAERTTMLTNFERDGFTIFRNVLDRDLIREIDAHIKWTIDKDPLHRPEAPTDVEINDPFFYRVFSDSRLLDIAEMFVGPDVALFIGGYLIKPPFTGKSIKWHQDGGFWPLDPMEVVTLWLAIDESTPENGCMRVVPGSHKNQMSAMRETDMSDLFGQEIAVDVDEADAIDIVLRPGDVEVHHPNIYHASEANTSAKRRAGMIIRYIPSTTRITDPALARSATWFRGNEHPEVNEFRPIPLFREGTHFPFRGAEAWA